MMLLRTLIAAAIIALASSFAAAEPRYSAMFVDGTRLSGDEVLNWHDTTAQPKLSDRLLFDARNPLRWLRDNHAQIAEVPSAYVELWGGDRVPGAVLSYLDGEQSAFERFPPHLTLEQANAVNWPDPRQIKQVRIAARFVKRIVWERLPADRYRPATLFYRDGRQAAFRNLRFEDAGVRLLLDDGTQEVPFSQIAELHLPRKESWEVYLEQLALLCPDDKARVVCVESSSGLRLTGSTERFQAKNYGSHPDHWHQALQPAWALDPIWMRHRDISLRAYFAPWELPLSALQPQRIEQRSTLGGGWTPQANRHAGGGPLRSGARDFAWGWGVHAQSALQFDLPPLAKRFRTVVGLDESIGSGGCVRASVHLESKEAPAIFQSPLLVGSRQTTESGWLDLGAESKRRLVLFADAAHEQRPRGADPFDVRDRLDWLEPLLELDRAGLRRAVDERLPSLIHAWDEWTLDVDDAGKAPIKAINYWDDADPRSLRYIVLAAPAEGRRSFSVKRRLKIGDGRHLLLLHVEWHERAGGRSSLAVRLGEDAPLAFDVPVRRLARGTEPISIPLDKHLGREIEIAIEQRAVGPRAAVAWNAISLVDGWPGTHVAFDDDRAFVDQLAASEGTAAWETRDRRFGDGCLRVLRTDGVDPHRATLSLPIRELPRLGEFRYLRFAWKMPEREQGRICLSLGHDNFWGPGIVADLRRRSFRYDAGQGEASYGAALRLSLTAPRDWTVVTRDLYADFGEFTLTGLSFGVPDGETALFDRICLGRTVKDLDQAESEEQSPR